MTGPLRVILVEDEAVILMQMEMLVEDAGHRVVGTAVGCAEGIALARALRPDVAFVDLHLGSGGSGLDVAMGLRDLDDVMVVFVTANARRTEDGFCGAAGVIAKPFTRAVVAGSMSYLEECLRRPPPALSVPHGMRMAPVYLERWAAVRS